MDKWIIKTIDDDIFTDREYWLDFLYNYHIHAIKKRGMSAAFLGLRRLGKTELFKRVYNMLFFNQDDVIPIFWTYEKKNLINPDFSKDYLENFLKQYFAFKNKDKYEEFLDTRFSALLDYGMEKGSKGIKTLIRRFVNQMKEGNENSMLTMAIEAPRTVTDYDEEPMIVLIDEFQEGFSIYNSDGKKANCIGSHQDAIDSRICPHIITGSTMTLILYDIVRKGPLFGRFSPVYIRGMEEYFAKELVYKWCKRYEIEVCQEMASELAVRCGGNPFYIEAVVKQAHIQGINLDNPEDLDKAHITDLTRGTIWRELEIQVQKFINQLNRQGIGKLILYHAARYETINSMTIEKIAAELKVSFNEVREMLSLMARADLLEESGIWGTLFYKIRDPIMNEFIQVWCEIEVEGKKANEAAFDKFEKYKKKADLLDSYIGQYNYYKGITVEIYILFMMTKWNFNELDGNRYFNIDQKVILPKFLYVDGCHVKYEDIGKAQVDLIGAKDFEQWFGECKYLKDRVGLDMVKEFVENKAEIAKKEFKRENTVLWFFSRSGFTPEAELYMKDRGVLYTNEEQLNELLTLFEVNTLPKELGNF